MIKDEIPKGDHLFENYEWILGNTLTGHKVENAFLELIFHSNYSTKRVFNPKQTIV